MNALNEFLKEKWMLNQLIRVQQRGERDCYEFQSQGNLLPVE